MEGDSNYRIDEDLMLKKSLSPFKIDMTFKIIIKIKFNNNFKNYII